MEQRPHPSDAAVIAAVLAGDIDSFAILLERYRDAFTRYAAHMLGSVEDADDALQSAFVRAFCHLDRCRDADRFAAWCFRIVVNECRTFGTRRSRRYRREERIASQAEAVRITDPPADAGTALRDEIQRALDRLEPAQREAFLLKYVEELSYEEMSEITGANESALKMRVKRARDRLRELLEGVHHD